MPGPTPIVSASRALERLLDPALADLAHAKLVTADELRRLTPSSNLLSILLLRVEPSPALRSAGVPLLDLHYLLNPWAPDADREHAILAGTLARLHESPVLPADAGLDALQLTPGALPLDALGGLFSALAIGLRPSLTLHLRGVRLDAAPHPHPAPPRA